MERKYKVLLIEDEKVMHLLFRKYIRDFGVTHEVTMIMSLEEAKTLLDNENFDVIVSDFLLGDGTAFEVMEHVPDIPLIIVTGAGDEQLAVTALKMGAYDYIAKALGEDFFRYLFMTIDNAIQFGKIEKQNKLFLDIAGVIIISMTKEQKISFVNNKGNKIFGYQKKEIVGRDFLDIVVPKDLKQSFMTNYQKLFLETSEPEGQFEMPVVTSNGETRTILWHYTQLRDKKGNVTDLLLSGEDITLQKELDNLKTEFVNVVSHEIRTPIASIMGFVELMLTRDLSKEKTNKYLNVIYKETKRLSDLINDVLDLQRIESGKQVFDMIDFCINNLIEDVLLIFKENNTHNIVVEVESENMHAFGDYNKIKQVLLNLLSNAIKYSPAGGDVILKAENLGNQIKVSVKDNGLGIPPDALPKLFTKFFRVNSPKHMEVKGTGLGLSICKEIIVAHGGTMWAESTFGDGSTFSFTLSIEENLCIVK